MFNNKAYSTINREERHYGFLFGSALIYDLNFAEAIITKYNNLIGSDLDFKQFEIYFEVAALRDYWFDLGDSFKYTPETHYKRRRILDSILQQKGYDKGIIDREKVFWTNGKIGTGKLWCPSEWNIGDLRNLEKKKNDLASVRWAFNAKPDILLVSNKSAVFIEIKIESGEGKSDSGYNQLEIQQEISKWMKLLIPEFSDKKFYNTSLTLNNELEMKGITWLEVINALKMTTDGKPGSKYVEKCLSVLSRYYEKK
jgi:hypothetical protein